MDTYFFKRMYMLAVSMGVAEDMVAKDKKHEIQ